MSNGSRLQATPLPLTPTQQEGLRARITEPLTPTEARPEQTAPASPGKFWLLVTAQGWTGS